VAVILEGDRLVKVNVAQVVSGQTAGSGDLESLLAGDVHASFASLLGLSWSVPSVTDLADGNEGRQGDRSKEKGSNKDQPSAVGNFRPNATTSPLGPTTVPIVGVTPWGIPLGDFAANGDVVGAPLSRSGGESVNDALADPRPAFVPSATSAPALTQRRVLNQNTAEASSVDDLGDQKLVEPLKGAPVANQDAAVTRAVTAPNEKSGVSAMGRSSSVSSGIVEPSAGLADSRLPALIQREGAVPNSIVGSVVQGHAVPNHETKPGTEGPNIAIGTGERSTDVPGQNGQGQVKLSTPFQGVVDEASSSTAAGHNQGNGGDAHRGSSDAKEALVNNRAPAAQASQAVSFEGTPGPGGSAHGHSAPMNSAHLESAREPAPDAQPKEMSPPRVADPSAARLLGSAMRGDVRVGVQTEAFGRVTIQTSAQGGQLSAQLSLENAKESATLAAHLPAVEQKIVQQHGLNASVRLVSGSDGGASAGFMGRDQSGSSRRDPERYHNDVVMRPNGIDHGSSNGSRGVESAVPGSTYVVTSRLDVTV
jgi:hypothetical protein